MTIFIFIGSGILSIYLLLWIYECGKKHGRREIYMEQAGQLKKAIEKDEPIIYKPSKK